jgi:hypothetical protein
VLSGGLSWALNRAKLDETLTQFVARIAHRRINMTFGVAYDDNISVDKKAIREVLNTDERFHKDPAAMVGIQGAGQQQRKSDCLALGDAFRLSGGKNGSERKSEGRV